jgi:hypothetical protein
VSSERDTKKAPFPKERSLKTVLMLERFTPLKPRSPLVALVGFASTAMILPWSLAPDIGEDKVGADMTEIEPQKVLVFVRFKEHGRVGMA